METPAAKRPCLGIATLAATAIEQAEMTPQPSTTTTPSTSSTTSTSSSQNSCKNSARRAYGAKKPLNLDEMAKGRDKGKDYK